MTIQRHGTHKRLELRQQLQPDCLAMELNFLLGLL